MPEKILVVDDAKSLRIFLKNILIRAQYEVMTASSGEEGLEIFRQFRPDLVLLDIVMPGIDGYEVCRKIRSDFASEFVKIIMISVKNRLDERLAGYATGADDYIGKPFEEDELLAKVRVFLRLKSVEDQLRELNDTLNEQVRIRTRQLLEAEKMAALGRHAAGIVHNLNSPLGAIMGTSEMLTLKYPDERLIIMQRKAASQMMRIISTILTTSHKESREEPTGLDMNEILRDQLELLKSDSFFKNKVQTELKLQPLPPYSGIYSHFSQSFANFIKNAADAMYDSKKKRLTVSSAVEDSIIIIRISDTGHGIPKDILGKIFNPFFTTKPHAIYEGRPTGTGLGLAYCMEIIRSYGGKITVDSTPGEGSVFTVHLPLKKQNCQ
jgi:signal transduction histidine kinase